MTEKFNDKQPKLHSGARVHALAYVQGEVTLGENSSLWPGASVRGDIAPVFIGKNSNVQDNATVHVSHQAPVVIGDNVTIGHNAVVHGATVEDDCIIGMGAIVLDGARIGAGSIVGAGAVIGPKKVIPVRCVVVGNPFKVLRQATDEDIAANIKNAAEYVQLSRQFT